MATADSNAFSITIASAPAVLSSLLFPPNVTGSSNSSPYGVIEFDQPQNNGLPPYGPGNAGWTMIRRIKPVQQTGYYAQFWMTRIESPPAAPFGSAYAGMHPYPTTQSTAGTAHWWEIAAFDGDVIDFNGNVPGNGSPIVVTKNQWYLQAMRCEYNGGNPVYTGWTNLPTITSASKIRYSGAARQTSGNWKVVIGNSPWMTAYTEERASCHHGQIKIIATALSEPDIASEANNMAALVTASAQSAIWWGKRGFASINDLTCDFGTGRSFVRNDVSNILTLGETL